MVGVVGVEVDVAVTTTGVEVVAGVGVEVAVTTTGVVVGVFVCADVIGAMAPVATNATAELRA